MAQLLRESGCECQLHVEEDMWHVFVLYGIPEAKDALNRMQEYLAQ
jgi:acetyl esterase/lipase